MANQTAVSGTICDSNLVPVTRAMVWFQPISSVSRKPLSYKDPRGVTVIAAAVSVHLDSSGNFSINLEDTSATAPVHIAYAMSVIDDVTGQNLLESGYGCIQPFGDAWALSQHDPDGLPGMTVVPGPPGKDGAPGSITSPIPNQVVFNGGFTANGMTVEAGDLTTQTYPTTFAGATGLELAGIDPEGGLHWQAAVSSTGPMTAPEFDLAVPGSAPAVSTTLVDTSSLASPDTRIVLSGPSGLSFGTVDKAGNVALDNGLLVAGPLTLSGTFAAPSQTGAVVDADGWNYFTAPDSNGKLQIFQNLGALTNQLTFGTANSWGPQLSADGTYLCFMTDRPTVGSTLAINAYRMSLGGSEQVPLSFNPDLSLQSDISVLAVAGQSLSGGAASGAPVTTTPYGHNLMLQGGTMQTGSYGNGAPTSLVPLIEMNFSGSGDETPCSAMANQFAYLCSLYKGFLPTIASQSSGAGGHTLDALFQPSQGWYPRMTAAFPFFTALATAAGRKAYPRAIGFVHGESDGNVPTAGNQNYAAQLLAYYLKWIQDIGTATGTFTAPPLFLTQTSSEYAYSNHAQNVIAPQQLAACINNPGRFYFAGPEYAMQQSYDTQNVHLLALGYQWIGQLLGTAMFRALVLKQRYTGLMPRQAVKMGSSIFVTFRVPRPLGASAAPALKIDTVNIPAYGLTGGKYGFEVRNASDAIVPISAVTLVPDAEGNLTQVRIDCASNPGAGGRVGYANTYQATAGASAVGPSGNLRTLWGVPALYPTIQADATYGDLFDWCPHFKIPYAS